MVLSILQLNYGGGFNAKSIEVVKWCDEHECDIICLTETWLCRRDCTVDHNCRVAHAIPGWVFHGRGREDGRERGGGVGFLVRDTIPFRPRFDLEVEGEHAWIELLPKGAQPVLLCSVYILQNLTAAQAFSGLRKATESALVETRRVLVTGDFNSRCIAFGDDVDTKYGEAAHSFMIDYDFELSNAIGVPTRVDYTGAESVLDLTLTHESIADLLLSWQAYEEFASDHAGVVFELKLPARRKRASSSRTVWGLDRCDWTLFRSELEPRLRLWAEQSSDMNTCEELYTSWVATVLQVAEKVVPRRVISESSKPYWNDELQRLSDARVRALKARNRARRRGELNDTLRERYRAAHNAFMNTSVRTKRSWMENLLSVPVGAPPETVWPKIRRARGRQPTPIAAVQVDDSVLTTTEDMANALNSYFSSRGDDSQQDFDTEFRSSLEAFLRTHPPDKCCAAEEELKEESNCTWCRPISVEEIRSRVSRLKKRKSPGADGILPEFVINGGDAIIGSLEVLFNRSFSSSSLPFLWHLAEVVPIRKARRGCRASDFRPISLLSVVGKLLDGIIADRLSSHAESQNWFPPFMGGFRRGRSSVDQVLHFTEDVFNSFSKKQVCVSAFLDLSAAYDRLYRDGLLVVLANQGVTGRTYEWIRAFVHTRVGRVRMGNTESTNLPYLYGVPQGSCLSPILFNLFMCDLAKFLEIPEGVQLGIYADDIRVSAFNESPEVAAQLVSAVLDQIQTWASSMRIVFDLESSKCGYMIFSHRKRDDISVSFGRSSLKRIRKPHRYLGIWMEENMSFRHHINVVRGKAWAALQSIRPLAKHVSFTTMRMLYLSCVRPILEYASSVWNSAATTYKNSLNKVQRVGLRIVAGADTSTSLESLQAYCSVLSLQARRDIALGNDFHRAARLSVEHPLGVQFARWNSSEKRSVHRRSYMGTASALFRRLQRHTPFDLGTTEIVESIDDPVLPQGTRRTLQPLTDTERQRRVHEHLQLLAAPLAPGDIWIHTDGSANPNPGPCGWGAMFDGFDSWEVQYAPIGIGSNFTAELVAILQALRTLVHRRIQFRTVRVFSDCLPAVLAARGEITPSSHALVVSEIRRILLLLQGPVVIEWVPGHEGIPPNEIADRLAKLAVRQLQDCTAPLPGQPPVPLVVARNFVRAAIVKREQLTWRKSAFTHVQNGTEHLSRLLQSVPKKPYFSHGNRKSQILMTKLRTADCQLRASRARKRRDVDPVCECGVEDETVAHFLLRCPLFDVHRVAMFEQVWTVHQAPSPITEETLLGSPQHLRDEKKAQVVLEAVFNYVKGTGKEI